MLGDQSTKLENRIYRGWEEYDAGNTNAIEDIYHELIPFCLRVCSKVCGRFINDNDEESSIAHLSILEAFSSYDPNKGKILVYLARVIRNRIIDFKRSEKKKQFLSLWEVDAALPIIQERQIDDIVEELARKQEIESLRWKVKSGKLKVEGGKWKVHTKMFYPDL
jgi:RNA polymerase sigma factor